ncbi:MAG: threonine--tRNA ligase [Firmicutes bacterium]|nr:threonine--tRNA ligase [Bacillota bacterium]
MSIQVTLPDGSVRACPEGSTVRDVAAGIGPGLAAAAVGALVDGRARGLAESIPGDASVAVLTFADPKGREIYRHTTSHVLAQAVKRLFPEAKLAIGPPIEDGFYYDFEVSRPFTPDDLTAIEAEMGRIIEDDLPLERREISREEARGLFLGLGERFKVDLVEDIPEGEMITIYKQGDFTDLCAGPHLPSTGRIRKIKLLSAAGAYWRGDERQPMLQRIYGTSFEKESELIAYLQRLEEARKRDHRRLGKELGLYQIHEETGPGLVFWYPKGARVRELIEDFWRREHRKRGYDLVYTPHIGKIDLWETSGHLDWFRENMYSPMEVEGKEYMLKPMNCPFHILIYESETRSYRDLPLRIGELGTVYRYERSGVLHGLLRVRGFTQDDAHIFCRPDQLEDELVEVIDLFQHMMKVFGFDNYEALLALRDPQSKKKYIGEDAVWERAEAALTAALQRKNLPYTRGEGDAKFYGPAIDITLKDALGRGWQGPTIQVDFNEPERFGINYMGEDGARHRPVIVHRVVLGSMERFFGSLIEHHAGAFPTWLAPVQVRVLPIADRHHDYGAEVRRKLEEHGARVEVDRRNEKIGYKIRDAELQKIPYMLVVGDREAAEGKVAVRQREKGDLGPMPVEEFAARIAPYLRPGGAV